MTDIPVVDAAAAAESRVRDRARRLFEFLKRFNERRSPPARDLSAAPWKLFFAELPAHPLITVGTGSEDADGVVLSVVRPKLTSCPLPPAAVRDWLLAGWQEPAKEAQVQRSRPRPQPASPSGVKPRTEFDAVERFEDDRVRAADFNTWKRTRAQWIAAEQSARDTAELYQELLGLWARLQREGDGLRLYLGDAFLTWQREGDTGGPVQHPLLLLDVELRLDEKKNTLTFVESSKPPFLYSQMLSLLPELMGTPRRLCRNIVDASGREGGCHPLATETTDGVIKQLAGVLDVHQLLPAGDSLAPPTGVRTIQRRVVLFAMPPLGGLEAACDSFLEWLAKGEALPLALARIVGQESAGSGKGEEVEGGTAQVIGKADLFFTKESNAAQEQIAQRLAESGTVLVQGPPGTGKTHTIANLIGHLLAQGKRVLVTAQTTKALRVLRDKVTPALQPLCVSILDSDLESRAELVHAVNGIVAKLTGSPSSFAPLAARLGLQRRELNAAIANKESELRAALRAEYEDIAVGGETVAPSVAARKLVENAARDGWLPGPVVYGEPLPLSATEVAELYGLTSEVSAGDERLVQQGLPDPGELLTTEQFAELVNELGSVAGALDAPSVWPAGVTRPHVSTLRPLAANLEAAIAPLVACSGWQLSCAQSGLLGQPHRESWEGLLVLIEEGAAEFPLLKPLVLEHEVVVGPLKVLDSAQKTAEDLAAHLDRGGSLSWFAMLGKSEWSDLIDASTVSGKRPTTSEHFRAIRAALRIGDLRDRLRRRWNAVMGAAGHPLPEQHALAPEEYAEAVVIEIRQLLNWWHAQFATFPTQLSALGVSFGSILDGVRAQPPHAEAKRLIVAVKEHILPAVRREIDRQRRIALEQRVQAGLVSLPSFPWLAAARAALESIRSRDVGAYFKAVGELWRLWSLKPKVTRRQELLQRLEPVARSWADQIRRRDDGHRGPALPGVPADAWLYRQWEEELNRRQKLDAHELQRALAQLRDELRDVNSRLVENLAWAAQVARTAPEEHRALMAWLDLVRRVGKGTGKRADDLKREAQRQLEVARDAVPVWIMPLTKVTESFVPGESRFDVVILDEASQCDLRTIAAISLGDSAVIVGDDEQVSPIDVGESVSELIALQDEYLSDFPDRDLFDGRASAYEIGRRSFPGGLIRLVEHFRCVPDIIGFSNSLSYKGEILPLREASSAKVAPALIPHRVLGGQRDAHAQTNRIEALELASLVAAACEAPSYKGLSFGVVSMLADSQAKVIDALLQRMLDTGEYKARRIVCGSPADFQGDERDVMFLSLVYSSEAGPLSLLQLDDQKRRYNVAASRARDQLWVLHSMDPEKDLKPGDLRRRLLEHAANPKNTRVADQRSRLESDFEHRVFEALVDRGYRVTSQVEVGAYRLDLVVEGEKGRVAIECDGHRFHPLEKLDQDLERQTILERLGWRFLRTRGSAFYRDPGKEVERIFRRLHELRIEPIGNAVASTSPAALGTSVEGLVARAAALRRAWVGEAGGSLDEFFEKSAPATRRGKWTPRVPRG